MRRPSKDSYCSHCGLPTESKIDDIYICDACYVIRGACCTEFEPEDHEAKTNKETHNCSRCGVETDKKLDDIYICDECYIIRCSCCPEFGPDDLSKEATD